MYLPRSDFFAWSVFKKEEKQLVGPVLFASDNDTSIVTYEFKIHGSRSSIRFSGDSKRDWDKEILLVRSVELLRDRHVLTVSRLLICLPDDPDLLFSFISSSSSSFSSACCFEWIFRNCNESSREDFDCLDQDKLLGGRRHRGERKTRTIPSYPSIQVALKKSFPDNNLLNDTIYEHESTAAYAIYLSRKTSRPTRLNALV